MSNAWGWWKEVAPVWKATLVLASAFVFGMTFGGWVGLPAQVKENTEAIHQNIEAIEDVAAGDRVTKNLVLKVLCNMDPAKNWHQCEREYGGSGDG